MWLVSRIDNNSDDDNLGIYSTKELADRAAKLLDADVTELELDKDWEPTDGLYLYSLYADLGRVSELDRPFSVFRENLDCDDAPYLTLVGWGNQPNSSYGTMAGKYRMFGRQKFHDEKEATSAIRLIIERLSLHSDLIRDISEGPAAVTDYRCESNDLGLTWTRKK